MIQKWKSILTNWINCYTSEGDKREHNITPENLLNIFTQIHESIRLDDSKSSKFEANTIQDFIVEKYPEFKFENGTLETTSEEEIYIIASLLLFFICVNSKNADIKRVMCNKLSMDDQETIMKFSKCLMDCSPILYADVEAAITEACGQDADKVSETPPALRSLHGEVRRLQAALDAERFDRNYLQDELARTNLKLEKLTKVKEQYKLEILNLKAKISLCCGEQRESHREARADEFIGRLQRQLQELEARLEDTLGQLDDVQQERDTYRKKVNDLKEERDKWLSLSQQEADRASQLADQLDTERRTVATLRELVVELRQHNRNNGLDSSMLECDDPDTSIQSLSNLSVCNEVCANVIEVQLGEERAKIEILKQQIQSLQEQLRKASQNFEFEKLSLEAVITEKESNISNLKQCVNEEIEEKNNLKKYYDQEIDSLNKKILEMSQMIKDLEESSKHALEQKEQEIQLLHAHFAQETDKLNNVNKNLQKEIENVIILKEHCNEEILLLTSKIGEMSQTIIHLEENTKHVLEEKEQGMRALQGLLKSETERFCNMINDLQQKIKEQNNLKTYHEQEIVKLNNDVTGLSEIITAEKENSKHMLEGKVQEIQSLQQQFVQKTEKANILINKLQIEIEEKNNINTKCEQEIAKLKNTLEEISQRAKAAEKDFEHALKENSQVIQSLQEKYITESKKSDTMIENLQKAVEKQNHLRHNYEQENIRLNNKIVEMSQVIKTVEDNSKHALEEKVQEILCLQQKFEKDTEILSTLIKRLQTEIEEQSDLKTHREQELIELNNKLFEKSQTAKAIEEQLRQALEGKVLEIQLKKDEFAVQNKKLGTIIENLQKEMENQTNLKYNCEQENIKLNHKIGEMSQKIKDMEQNSKCALEEKVQVIKSLYQQFAEEKEMSGDMIQKLQNETEDQRQENLKLGSKIVAMSQTIKDVEESSKLALEEKIKEIQLLQQTFAEETKKLEVKNKIQEMEILEAYDLKKRSDQEIVELNNKVVEMIEIIRDTEESSKLSLEEKVQEKDYLQQQFAVESEKSVNIIKNLNQELETEKQQLLMLKEDFDSRITKLDEKILNQNNELVELNKQIIQKSEMIELIQSDLRKEKELKDELSSTYNHQLLTLNKQKCAVEADLQELQRQLLDKEMLIDKLDKEVKNLNIYVSSLKNISEEKQKEVDSLNHEIDKLNTNIVEKSQAIKDLEEISRIALEEKAQVIQTLHQQFAAESGKSDNIIKNLKIELEAEKYAQLKLRDDFDSRFMKLNEKVLNRNNELVELQNNIIQKSELIEVLQSDLRREKELRDELSNTCNHQLSTLNEQKNAIETIVQQKLQEITELQRQLQEKEMLVIKLKTEIEKLGTSISSLEEKCRHRDSVIKEKQKEIEFINDVFQNEQEKLNHKIDERNASIKSLQMQLQNEIDYKMQLQRELSELKTSKQTLIEEFNAAKILAKEHGEKSLLWEEQKIEMTEKIQTIIHRVETLEKEKALLLKDIESLKDIQSGEIKNQQENIVKWENEKVEMNKQIQANILKVKKQEDDKVLLLKEIEEIKAAQSEELKNHEEKIRTWEKQKIEMNEQIQVNILKVEKLENDKVGLIKEIEAIKSLLKCETKDHENNKVQWEKQNNIIKEQLQANVLKIEKLEEEKALLIKDKEALTAAKNEGMKDHEANTALWEKQKMEINEKITANILKVKNLEDQKMLLLKEIEGLKNSQNEETKKYAENTLIWEKQKKEMKEQIQVNNKKIEKFEDEKILQLKELEELKTVQKRVSKEHNENMKMWEKQKNEMIEQIQFSVEKHNDEKTILMKEIETLKAAQREEVKELEEKTAVWEKQTIELKEQIHINILKIQKLEEDKAILSKEMEELKAAQREKAKDLEEQTLVWVRQKTEMKEQMYSNVLKVKTLEEEKTTLLKEIEALKAANHEEKTLMWERQKTGMNEQMQGYILKVDEVEQEKAMIIKELEALKTTQMETCFKKDHAEKINMLEKQEAVMKQQMQANIRKIEALEEEKVMLSKEVEALKAAQKEMLAMASHDKITATKHTSWEKEIQDMHQVDTTSDLTHSSMDSLKTISDLEKIIQDKNRKITTMQTEITYIKSMIAESGIKFIDITKELEVSKDTCQELSSQLKKIVHQKNEEIAELRRQIAKMSATENRASQIIKVSAKYQAMILKRIAEIKSNAVLKELTNFGNQNSNGDNEMRRSFAGSVTMEDLENFLETTDKHLKRCSEKQLALQKDRDRLSEVNRINESEIINMKKFLTEMSVSFRTFCTVKEVYNQKLSKIVSLQRTVRRDILSLDGRITEATMCKLERGYAAVMQDLSECAMNLERWVDRSVSRMLSAEKIKQAFTSDLEQASLSTCNYQNAAVEVQLSELENSFQKLLEEIGRAHKGEGARTAQEVTIMEVRAEYEDKLNRMKAKMKELFHEEMGRLKQKQADEIAILERELVKSREKMAESSRAYEEHIRALTTELWSVGEKFLVKQEEADWLRKKQSGSLMSLQHVHSSGLLPPKESFGRPSDTHSLRSLPVHNKKSEARGLHMSDEEGEVFDNRFLKELSATPRASLAPGQRISELKRRNSLVPPHLKSSYPAEMQFAPTLDEEDIKCPSPSLTMGRGPRKEVGITAYKKPGPPTPSKQAGRLSATDSELRESLRTDPDAQSGRKTSTPSRIRSLFRSNRNDMDGTPRSRRFSNIFRKK